MEKKYHGIIPPIATPVDKHENVEESAFRSLIDYCIAGGLHGSYVAGTNGETMQLTQRERNHAIQICVDQVNGRVPVIAGCMDQYTPCHREHQSGGGSGRRLCGRDPHFL